MSLTRQQMGLQRTAMRHETIRGGSPIIPVTWQLASDAGEVQCALQSLGLIVQGSSGGHFGLVFGGGVFVAEYVGDLAFLLPIFFVVCLFFSEQQAKYHDT